MMMLIPEAWAGNPLMDEKRRAFYEYHAALMEPWDGPAAVAFTDGRQIGATLDRNGLRPRAIRHQGRPSSWRPKWACCTVPEDQIVKKWRLQPGKMLLVDLEKGRIIPDEELKAEIAASHPYQDWLDARSSLSRSCRPRRTRRRARTSRCSIGSRPSATPQEDLKLLMTPMAATGRKPSARWATTRRSRRSPKAEAALHLFQAELRAGHQPADRSDPRRAGDEPGLVHRPAPEHARHGRASKNKRLEAHQPILTNDDLEKIREIGDRVDSHFNSKTLDVTYPAVQGRGGHGARARPALRPRGSAVRTGLQHHHPVGSRGLGRSHSHPDRCWPARPCIIT
jgi:glutamate synthase (NADPH/NADH) large chain